MYAVGFQLFQGRLIPRMGSDGSRRLNTRSRKGWETEITAIRQHCPVVYIVPNFTQAMCEMNAAELLAKCEQIALCTFEGVKI